MNMQRIQWKTLVTDPASADPNLFFKVFNTWIPDSPEIYVDVADYQHVTDGPLILLAGHFVDYALDATDGKTGLVYSSKRDLDGENQDKLNTTLSDHLKACVRLEKDAEMKVKGLKFRGDSLFCIINDRALAPNDEKSFEILKSELEPVAKKLFGETGFKINHVGEPRSRLMAEITASVQPSVEELLGNLNC